jgi:hypothetical protein
MQANMLQIGKEAWRNGDHFPGRPKMRLLMIRR